MIPPQAKFDECELVYPAKSPLSITATDRPFFDNAAALTAPLIPAPHWKPNARAALEAVCYQTNDLLHAMAQDGVQSTSVLVDGGMVANDWLCQCLADILQVDIQRPVNMESTALGAAFLAGLQLGLYASVEEISELKAIERVFTPSIDPQIRQACLARWQAAVQSTLLFAQANG